MLTFTVYLVQTSWKEKQSAIPSYGAIAGIFCCMKAA